MSPAAVRPPDGGWGWVIVASSFCIHFCIDGVTYAFGVLAAEFVDNLGCSRQLNGWIASAMVGVTLGGGPIASVASTKFGRRPVTIAGAAIAAAGYAVSFFVTEAWVLILTVGVVTGFGMSLIYLSAIVCVGIYFDKRRSTALGIAVCGSGCGTFVFSPLISLLIETYTWRGTMLILSGVMLHCAVFGSLFRPLPVELPDKGERLLASESGGNAKATNFMSVQDMSRHSARDNGLTMKQRSYSVATPEITSEIRLTHVSRPAHFVRSITSLAEETPQAARTLRSALRQELAGLLNLSLMRNAAFIMFIFSNLLCSIGFNAPFLYMPDRAQQAGNSRTDSSLLVSIIGMANMAGRVCFGFLSDRQGVNRLMLYNAALAIAGCVLVFSFASDSYVFMAVYCAMFGVFIGTYVTLTSPVLVDLLGLEKLSDSFGLTLLFQGIGVLVGPPIAGFIFDSTASFDIPFIVCGTCVLISGLMLLPVPCVIRWQFGSSHVTSTVQF